MQNFKRKWEKYKFIGLVFFILLLAPIIIFILGRLISLIKPIFSYPLSNLVDFYESYIPSVMTVVVAFLAIVQTNKLHKENLKKQKEANRRLYGSKIIIENENLIVYDTGTEETKANLNEQRITHSINKDLILDLYSPLGKRTSESQKMGLKFNLLNASEYEVSFMKINARSFHKDNFYKGILRDFDSIEKNKTKEIYVNFKINKEDPLYKIICDGGSLTLIFDFYTFTKDTKSVNLNVSMVYLEFSRENGVTTGNCLKVINGINKDFFEMFFDGQIVSNPSIIFTDDEKFVTDEYWDV